MVKMKKRMKNKDNIRRTKKKISFLSSEKIEYVDWKDANLLRRFMSERAKIRSRRVTGNDTRQQNLVADAIKVAREMALVPYSNRVTTQRQNRDRSAKSWAETPMPRPTAPPPVGETEDHAPDATEAADSPPPSRDATGHGASEIEDVTASESAVAAVRPS